jgi:uncharacterized phage protein gp47/JayE
MTYGVTVDGFVKKTFSVILEELEDYVTENLSKNLTRDHLSVIGHLNTNDAQELSELWEVAQAIYSNQTRDGASGVNLQYIAALTGSYLSDYSKTVVDATVTLNPNTTLSVGSVANLGGQPSVRFVSLTEVVAGVGGGDYDVQFEAEEEGAITVSADQLNEVAEPQSGWLAVTNDNPGSTGTQPEDDPEFRVKIEEELAARGSTNIDAIAANIIRYTDCTECKVYENDTDLTDENLIPPHTIWTICKDGDDQDIADEIFFKKATGIRTKGTEVLTVDDLKGEPHETRFSYAVEEPIDIGYTVQFLPEYLDDIETVQANIVEAVEAYFDGFKIGEDVIYLDLLCIIKNIEGIDKDFGIQLFLNDAQNDIEIDIYKIAVVDVIHYGS